MQDPTRNLGPVEPETADILPDIVLVAGNWRGCMTQAQNSELRNLVAHMMLTDYGDLVRIANQLCSLLDLYDNIYSYMVGDEQPLPVG